MSEILSNLGNAAPSPGRLLPYPYGMCEIDADLYGEDCELSDMLHEQCATVARWRDDQLFAGAKECPAES